MIRIKYGNHKLGDDTVILNMGPARTCPSKARDLCEVVKKGYRCYAEKAEIQYPRNVPQYRQAQELYWKITPKEKIAHDISKKIGARRKRTRFLRYNESGDFHCQQDIEKLSYVAKYLKRNHSITTYGYSARNDLDFSSAEFLVKGSYNDNGNNGKCVVISKDEEVPEGYFLCPADCRKCNKCKRHNYKNIAFRKH